jgi:hypothetical protein
LNVPSFRNEGNGVGLPSLCNVIRIFSRRRDFRDQPIITYPLPNTLPDLTGNEQDFPEAGRSSRAVKANCKVPAALPGCASCLRHTSSAPSFAHEDTDAAMRRWMVREMKASPKMPQELTDLRRPHPGLADSKPVEKMLGVCAGWDPQRKRTPR